jgi:hypothetical protein
MNDLISRQAAIDAAKHAWAKGLEPSQYIELLPSAQPEMTDEQFEDYCRKRCLSVVTNEFMEDVRKMVPTVRPKPGKWIERKSDTEDKENGFETVIVCSRCGYPATTFYSEDCESRTQIRTAFCPTCGADMRGNEDGTDL